MRPEPRGHTRALSGAGPACSSRTARRRTHPRRRGAWSRRRSGSRARRVLGQTGAAVGLPGAEVELEAAVVAVAGVDGPVAAGLALREGVPHGAAAGEVGGDLRLFLGADLDDRVDRLALDVGR